MKAIYINLDPYLAAFAAWLKGGKSGPAPTAPTIPLSVTIPLGETAVLYVPHNPDGPEEMYNEATIDGQTVEFCGPDPTGTEIATKLVPGLSALAPSAKYYALPVTGDTSLTVLIDNSGFEDGISVTIPVLVRRETASGPVDLVDFTPPASAADIKAALVAAGNGALAGVNLGEAIIIATGADGATLVSPTEEVNPSALQRLNWQGSNEITLGSSAS